MAEADKYTLEDLIDKSNGWDWEKSHVSESYIDETGATKQSVSANDIVEAGSVLICAGPADLPEASKRGQLNIVPIGMVESAQISLNKQINRIFEIGSKVSYIISGRVMGGISLSRVFFDGPSLLKALYRGEVIEDEADQEYKKAKFASKGGKDGEFEEFSHISSENLAMNLDSAFFDNPIGLCFIFKDQSKQNVGQMYFEGCHITTYGMGISANMNVLSESVSIEFTKVTPVVISATDGNSGASSLTDRNIVSAQQAIRPSLQ